MDKLGNLHVTRQKIKKLYFDYELINLYNNTGHLTTQ